MRSCPGCQEKTLSFYQLGHLGVSTATICRGCGAHVSLSMGVDALLWVPVLVGIVVAIAFDFNPDATGKELGWMFGIMGLSMVPVWLVMTSSLPLKVVEDGSSAPSTERTVDSETPPLHVPAIDLAPSIFAPQLEAASRERAESHAAPEMSSRSSPGRSRPRPSGARSVFDDVS